MSPAFRLRERRLRRRIERAAKKMFGFSILLSGLLFAVLLVDQGFGLSFGQLAW